MKTINNNANINLKIDAPETLSVFCFDTIIVEEAFLTFIREAYEEDMLSAHREYGEVLRSIHNRLISEGYVFSNGKFYKKDDKM